MAEGRGFEPPVGLLLRLISSQVPLTTQPPFHTVFKADKEILGLTSGRRQADSQTDGAKLTALSRKGFSTAAALAGFWVDDFEPAVRE
jgi:hypothetical protein